MFIRPYQYSLKYYCIPNEINLKLFMSRSMIHISIKYSLDILMRRLTRGRQKKSSMHLIKIFL